MCRMCCAVLVVSVYKSVCRIDMPDMQVLEGALHHSIVAVLVLACVLPPTGPYHRWYTPPPPSCQTDTAGIASSFAAVALIPQPCIKANHHPTLAV